VPGERLGVRRLRAARALRRRRPRAPDCRRLSPLWSPKRSACCRGTVRELAVSVDGQPTSFTTVGHGQRFAAVGHAHGLTITIAGYGANLALGALEPSTLKGPR
jgi:hypothetical protein